MISVKGWAVKNKGSDIILIVTSEDVRSFEEGYWTTVGLMNADLPLRWEEVVAPALQDTLQWPSKMRVTVCKLDSGEIKIF